jgi:hypothetical protein
MSTTRSGIRLQKCCNDGWHDWDVESSLSGEKQHSTVLCVCVTVCVIVFFICFVKLLTPGDSPATASPGGTTVPGGTTNGASNGATGAPGSSSVNNGASGGTTTTTSTPVLTLGNGPTPGFTTAPRGGDTQKDKACNPACEICPNGSGNSASRKRACKQTWGAVKASLVGNNCGYEPGSTTTAKWTDESCVVEEKACIPPRGSTERPNYETCSNPVPCERDSPGWKCSTCYIVADDGSQQHLSPNAAPVGCDAAQLALTQALWLVGVLAAMVGM